MIKLTCEGVAQERLTALEGKINEALADRFSAMMYAKRDPMPNCRCIIILSDDSSIIDADWEVVPNKLQLPEHDDGKP